MPAAPAATGTRWFAPAELPPLPDPLTLDALYALFPDATDKPAVTPLPGDQLPEPYRGLLVHTHHMTVTVERFHGRPVDVRVLQTRHVGNSYARKILLTLRPGGEVVQFGLVEVDLGLLAPEVRDGIVEGKTPLGRVLIDNDVLRVVRPVQYFRAVLSTVMAGWFGLPGPATTYGRLGVIYTDGKPAIKVIEILTPVGG